MDIFLCVPNDDLPIVDVATRGKKSSITVPFDAYNLEAVALQLRCVLGLLPIVDSLESLANKFYQKTNRNFVTNFLKLFLTQGSLPASPEAIRLPSGETARQQTAR